MGDAHARWAGPVLLGFHLLAYQSGERGPQLLRDRGGEGGSSVSDVNDDDDDIDIPNINATTLLPDHHLNNLFSLSSSWSPSPYLILTLFLTRPLRSGISPATQSLARTKPIYSKKKAHPAQKFEKDKISNHVVCSSSW